MNRLQDRVAVVTGGGTGIGRAICPGSVATPMISAITEQLRALTGESREDFVRERIASKNLQQRLLDPEEIAYMAVYLASDQARGVTGQALNVCAGTVLY